MKLDQIAAAAHMGIAVKTLENWRILKAGPPYYKIGNRVLYDSAELDAWLAERRVVPAEKPRRVMCGVVTTDAAPPGLPIIDQRRERE
jgi:hypothetical protein